MCSYPRAPASHVIGIPDHLTIHETIAIINPLAISYHALVNVARLQSGERILIHSAAAGTGQMAVSIVLGRGAQVFATIGSNKKKEMLIARFRIPVEHIFYSTDTSFAQGIKRVAGSVDVLLNSLAGGQLQASWECVAPYGRVIEIGKSDIIAKSSLPMSLFAKNVTFAAVDLHHIALTNAMLSRQLVEQAI
jgi:NADPH:quinone reductase-like Zn-dependent oxidoreductase